MRYNRKKLFDKQYVRVLRNLLSIDNWSGSVSDILAENFFVFDRNGAYSTILREAESPKRRRLIDVLCGIGALTDRRHMKVKKDIERLLQAENITCPN